MKKSTFTFTFIALFAAGISLTSCNNASEKTEEDKTEEVSENDDEMNHNQGDEHHDEMNHNHGDEHHDETADANEDKPSGDKKSGETAQFLEAYFEIKNGLVADSKENAAKGATALEAAFLGFDMSKLTDETHKKYMKIVEKAKEHTTHIIEGDIEYQRENFENLTTNVTDLISLLGTDKVIYQDFCPMANNNKGAYWLSEVKEIRNPYFGSKMMTCGSVKKQFN
jgi:hypothetical protein